MPISWFDQSNSIRRSSCGTPMISAMACSGSSAARSSTKSHDAALDDVVDDEDRPVREVLLEQRDHPGREALLDQRAIAGVLRRVHVEHHQAARIGAPAGGLTIVEVEDADAADLGREGRRVAVDLDQVVVLHDVPEPGDRSARPCQYIGASARRLLEHLVVLEPLEAVEIQEVDVVQRHRSHSPRGTEVPAILTAVKLAAGWGPHVSSGSIWAAKLGRRWSHTLTPGGCGCASQASCCMK